MKKLACLMLLLAMSAGPAAADRYHVRSQGLRTSGASLAGDWQLENCYESVALAAQSAGPADSLLLYKEDHFVSELVQMTEFVSNQDLDATWSACRLWLSDPARLGLKAGCTGSVIRGLSFVGDDPSSVHPALILDNPTSAARQVTIEDCHFYDHHGSYNSSEGGSCLHVSGDAPGLQLTVTRSQFRNSSSSGHGGAVYVSDNCEVVLEDCEFVANSTQTGNPYRGGAIAVQSPTVFGTFTMIRCTVEGSSSQGPGGGVSVEDSHCTLEDCHIIGSRSGLESWPAGAGLFMRRTVPGDTTDDLLLIVTGCEFKDNVGNVTAYGDAGDGGGILVKGCCYERLTTAQIADCEFDNNYNSQGGGLYVGRYAQATIVRSSFRRNSTFYNGGAAYKGGLLWVNRGETARFEYCEFVENRSGYDSTGEPTDLNGKGGACTIRHYPRAEFLNCSFVNNYVGGNLRLGDAIHHTAEGGAFEDSLMQCTLHNCVFYGTKGNDIQVRSDPDGFAIVTHCAWQPGEFDCAGVSPISTVTLRENPFASEWNLRLNAKSPCIDAGLLLGLPLDILGTEIPQGNGPDIGAYEYPLPIGVHGTPSPAAAGLRAAPNPFNPRTIISFELGHSAAVRLTIHDLTGRLVTVLVDDILAAGQHRQPWNGMDRAGRPVASGIYQVRLELPDRAENAKLMLVR